MRRGEEEKRAIAFRICTNLRKVSVHPGILDKGEVIITLSCGFLIPTAEGKEVFCRHAKDTSKNLLGKDVPDWIIDLVWNIFNSCEDTGSNERFIPVPASIAA